MNKKYTVKKLILSASFVLISILTFSQTYKFDVKSYDFYIVSGFSEKDTILKNITEFEPYVSDRSYRLNLDEKELYFYEDGKFVEKFKVADVITNGLETEIVVQSYDEGSSDTSTFSIYLKIKEKEVTDICLFWYDPFGDRTLVKKVKQ